MKKLLYPFFALSLLAIVSCEEDENKVPVPEPILTDAVSYNGKNYSIDNGTIIDWGSYGNHYNFDFFLTDGELDFENEKAEGATVVIYAELWSPGTENFSTGTFTFDNSGEVDGKRYFENVDVLFDINNNGEIDENDEKLAAKAGTIKVSSSGTNYSVEVDITLDNNKLVKGSYSGTFDVFEGTIEENGRGSQKAGKFGKHSRK